jgi:hypothetical protein
MAKTGGKITSALGSLLGTEAARGTEGDSGCWPGGQTPGGARGSGTDSWRSCWPDPDDLRRGDPRPADAIRRIVRGR